MRQPKARSESGETLIELLCAIMIIGIAGTAILGGFTFLVQSSVLGRQQANSTAHVRTAAEAIQRSVAAAGSLACGTNYAGIGQSAVTAAASNGSAYTVAVGTPQSWLGTSWGTCTGNGSQRIEITVQSPGSGAKQALEKLTLVLRKPCNGTVAAPC
jgi:type II secretory pathway pseudopilin PulG